MKRASLVPLSDRAQLERTVLKRIYGLEKVPLATATVKCYRPTDRIKVYYNLCDAFACTKDPLTRESLNPPLLNTAAAQQRVVAVLQSCQSTRRQHTTALESIGYDDRWRLLHLALATMQLFQIPDLYALVHGFEILPAGMGNGWRAVATPFHNWLRGSPAGVPRARLITLDVDLQAWNFRTMITWINLVMAPCGIIAKGSLQNGVRLTGIWMGTP